MSRSHWLWLLLLVAVIATPLIAGPPTPESIRWIIAARFPSVSWIDASTLASWMQDDAPRALLLLDVRTQEEYAVSHLRGAVHVDPVRPRVLELPILEDATVVVHCSVGYRSADLAEELRDRGVDQVYNLTGGIFGWANAGRPLSRDETRVQAVHPYDKAWGWFVRDDLRAEAKPR